MEGVINSCNVRSHRIELHVPAIICTSTLPMPSSPAQPPASSSTPLTPNTNFFASLSRATLLPSCGLRWLTGDNTIVDTRGRWVQSEAHERQ